MTNEQNNGMSMENERRRLEQDREYQADFLDNEFNKQLIEDVDVAPSFVSEEGEGKDLDGMFPEMQLKSSPYQDEFSQEPVIKQGRDEEDKFEQER
ncbi:hypothetical protein [Sporosarcina sp. Te-1]|uniref:hypothetical protein n=1 Tax=Sporosarcina sp. Te-1 TaxID=2818390 RepID=UPI001A9EBC04|nr:hypothetical protein [Sporosarcina sp. Te-1]QTD41968.1 hypothetical protein J3U78_03760 [Sporosarcina sp. Te-1]